MNESLVFCGFVIMSMYFVYRGCKEDAMTDAMTDAMADAMTDDKAEYTPSNAETSVLAQEDQPPSYKSIVRDH